MRAHVRSGGWAHPPVERLSQRLIRRSLRRGEHSLQPQCEAYGGADSNSRFILESWNILACPPSDRPIAAMHAVELLRPTMRPHHRRPQHRTPSPRPRRPPSHPHPHALVLDGLFPPRRRRGSSRARSRTPPPRDIPSSNHAVAGTYVIDPALPARARAEDLQAPLNSARTLTESTTTPVESRFSSFL